MHGGCCLWSGNVNKEKRSGDKEVEGDGQQEMKHGMNSIKSEGEQLAGEGLLWCA